MKSQNRPQALVEQAKKQYEAQEYQKAAELYAAAADYYREAGDPVQAAEMENNRSVALLQAGDAQGALDAALGTDEVFAAAGDLRRQAIALSNQAAAYEELQQLESAYELYSRASDLFKTAGEKDMRSYVLARISNLQARRGDRFEAVASLHTALENRKNLSLKERALKGLINKAMDMLGGK